MNILFFTKKLNNVCYPGKLLAPAESFGQDFFGCWAQILEPF